MVKEAVDVTTNQSTKYAVKIVTKSKLFDAEETKLKDEIALMKEVSEHHHRHDAKSNNNNNNNIVQLYNVYDEPEHYYLVMERMYGGDLLR